MTNMLCENANLLINLNAQEQRMWDYQRHRKMYFTKLQIAIIPARLISSL